MAKNIDIDQVLIRWKDFVCRKDHSMEDIPISLGFSTTGALILKYTLSSTPRIFKSFEEFFIWMDHYLGTQ